MANNLTRGKVVGLLDLPEVNGPECGVAHPPSVEVYPTPSTVNPPIGSIRPAVSGGTADGRACTHAELLLRRSGGGDEQVPTQELDEEAARRVVAYERSGLWFRVALQRGSGWVRRARAKDFWSYPQGLLDKLAYLRKGWDGRLWAAPGTEAAPHRVPPKWRTRNDSGNTLVEFLGYRDVGGQTWIHVRVQAEDEFGMPGVKGPAGWLPAYRPSGLTSAWFYSRD